jgi:hypothetical protein
VFASGNLPEENKAMMLSALVSSPTYVKHTGSQGRAGTAIEQFTLQDNVWIKLAIDTASPQSKLQVCLPRGSIFSKTQNGWYLNNSHVPGEFWAYTAGDH